MARLGVNVDAHGGVSAEFIASTGATLARYVGHQSGQRNYAQSLLEYGITPLLVLGSEPESLGRNALGWLAAARAIAEEHRGLRVVYQAGNEPDASLGADQNQDGVTTMEERMAASPSSWVMSWSEVDYLIGVCRQAVGSASLIGPGLSSGHPSWLEVLAGPGFRNLRSLDGIACHPYAKQPGTPELKSLLDGYLAFQMPLWVTEYDSRTLGMAAYLSEFPGLDCALAFALHAGVPEFQMRGVSLADFSTAAAALQIGSESPLASQQGPFRFALGFLAMSNALPAVIGSPVENERGVRAGISMQRTTKGLLVWVEASRSPRRAELLTFTEWSSGKRYEWNGGTGAVQEVRG